MTERRSDREVVLTSSQVLIILLLLVILLSVVFVLGISVGKRQKTASTQVKEELPPVVVKEEMEPEKGVQKIEKKEEKATESISASRFYYVQIGAFSSESSANSFAEKFREKNYPVKVVPPLSDDKVRVYRVRIGPYLKLEEVKEVLNRLKETGKENYFIVSEGGR